MDDAITKHSAKYDVFISHSSNNKNITHAICANFEKNGIKCWYAPRDIMPGESWPSAIKAGIKDASVFVLVFSEKSNESKQVINEVAMAFNEEKTIIPFRISETQMNDDLEYFLNRVHWLDAVSEPMEQSIDELRNYVERVMGYDVVEKDEEYSLKSVDVQDAKNIVEPQEKKKENSVKKKHKKQIIISSILAIIVLSISVLCYCFLGNTDEDSLMEKALESYYSKYHSTEDNAKARELLKKLVGKDEADAYYYLGKLDERVCDYDSAMNNYKLGIKKGSDLARLGLCELHINGFDNGSIQWEEVIILVETALSNNCTEANYYMGILYEKGLAGYEIDKEKAIKYYEKVRDCDAGIAALALYNSAWIYGNGLVGAEDLDKAIQCTNEAIKLDSYIEGDGKISLGKISYYSEKFEMSAEYYDEAFEFISEAVNAGDIASMNKLGVLYENEQYNDKNSIKAISYYTNAADVGNPYANYNLGLLYAEGVIGGSSDYIMALKYYKNAADVGHVEAKYRIGTLYCEGRLSETGEPSMEDYKKAEQLFKESAEMGDINAINYLGILYENGWVGERDCKKAKDLYVKAANNGNYVSEYNLGMLYLDEYFEEHSYEEAVYWLKRSANNGYSPATEQLDKLYQEGKLN